VDALTLHSPILAVTIPLLAAFITPLIGRAGPRTRDVFVITSLVLLEIVVVVLASRSMSSSAVCTPWAP
jgi:formate hydrogenlyase subunit 4